MKISIFLIIGFTQFVFCCDPNVTDVLYPDCPVNFFRRKRALGDYTRWRANIEPTQQFLVKVLDDDLPSQKSKKIVAVNIQPVTKSVEKIIIGGAMVPTSTTNSPDVNLMDTLKEYTRFVPPTTVATRIDDDLYHARVNSVPPIRSEKHEPIVVKARNPQRDESPPASPQFLPRSQMVTVHQYAPIAPVAFARRSEIPPLTPRNPVSNSYIIRKVIANMMTSTLPNDILAPSRTKSDMEEFGHLQAFEEDSDRFDITRTTLTTLEEPKRTVSLFFGTTTTTSTASDFFPTPGLNKIDDYLEKKNEDKDSDTEDSIFYSYEDDIAKKLEKTSSDLYDDKFKNQRNELEEFDAPDNAKSITPPPGRSNVTNEDYNEIDDESVPHKRKLDSTISTVTPTSTSNDYVTRKNIIESLRDKRHQVCSLIKRRELNFNSPRTLPEIEEKLKQWAEVSPVAKIVDISDGNLTALERSIYMMIVDDPSSGQIISAKQTVVVVAGIQGRDQHAVSAAMYLLYQLIERTQQHSDLLSKYRFWIIPVFNPDGYDYATTFPHRREWAKNLRQNWDVCKGREACKACESYGLRCTVQPCYGVNLDRNFEYQWIPAEELRMEHPCGALYAGKRQLSEVETSSFVQYLHSQHKPIYLFIAFKEGEVLGVMYPYSHTKKKRALEHVFKQRASLAAAAAYSISGRPYLAGQTSQFLPLYAGGIEDWVDGHLGVDNTFTIMMYRPMDTFNSKVSMERVVHEAYAALDTLVLQSTAESAAEQAPRVALTEVKYSSTHTAHISPTLLALVTVLHVRFT